MSEWRPDLELLQAFSRQGDQQAFAALTRRHLDLVYATALRKVTDDGAAEEICQNVFGTLARKAWQFAPDDSLPSWLHRTTLLEGKSWLRGELRRRRREQAAAELGTTMKTPDEQPAFNALVPLLDEALLSLRDKDRTALLLRYHESQSLRDVGVSLGTSEDAARKRVAAALEKLSQFFQRRGFRTATVAAMTAVLQHTAASAAASTATVVVNAALQSAPPALVGLSALLARLASLTKVQTAAVCVVLATVPVAWEWNEARAAKKEAAQVQTQVADASAEHLTLRTEIERLRESSQRLNASLGTATDLARQRADAAENFDAWKNRIRGLLSADDYRWPDDSPFVRIPKSALSKISPKRSVRPPGVVEPEVRELFGLTPQERQSLEDTLHNHFADVDGLMEAMLFETNKPARVYVPADTLASKTFVVPALGEEAKERADQMLAAMKNTFGEERWALVAANLESYGTHTLRRILNLDAHANKQEITVWVRDDKAGPVTGYAWTGDRASFSASGGPLSSFLPDADPATAKNIVADLRRNDLPDTLTLRMLAWLQQEATARLGKKTNP